MTTEPTDAEIDAIVQTCRERGLRELDVFRAVLAKWGTPPAEQQATKETSGGFHVWRDISTAPKDGSRFVATGYNYGLYSEGRHACVAQWFRGSWIEASEWNEASELTYLTHWMPLPSPPDDVAAIQGEMNVQLDIDSNYSAPGQQQNVARTVAMGQPLGRGQDQAAGDLGAQGNKLLTVAERNIRSFLRSAQFKSESDREAALKCVDVLWAAARKQGGA